MKFFITEILEITTTKFHPEENFIASGQSSLGKLVQCDLWNVIKCKWKKTNKQNSIYSNFWLIYYHHLSEVPKHLSFEFDQ